MECFDVSFFHPADENLELEPRCFCVESFLFFFLLIVLEIHCVGLEYIGSISTFSSLLITFKNIQSNFKGMHLLLYILVKLDLNFPLVQ